MRAHTTDLPPLGTLCIDSCLALNPGHSRLPGTSAGRSGWVVGPRHEPPSAVHLPRLSLGIYEARARHTWGFALSQSFLWGKLGDPTTQGGPSSMELTPWGESFLGCELCFVAGPSFRALSLTLGAAGQWGDGNKTEIKQKDPEYPTGQCRRAKIN